MSAYYAWLSRLRLIRRWGLMHAIQPENDAEHSLQAAMIAHGIAVIARDRYGRDISPEQAATVALYHDVSEIFTGDLPTPVKYGSGQLHEAYGMMEQLAKKKLLDMVPGDLQPSFQPYLCPDESTYLWRIVKAADRISAYARCQEEVAGGNREFFDAAVSVKQSIDQLDLPEVQDFMREFGQSFGFSLDELGGNSL